jgi:hypothetical protein
MKEKTSSLNEIPDMYVSYNKSDIKAALDLYAKFASLEKDIRLLKEELCNIAHKIDFNGIVLHGFWISFDDVAKKNPIINEIRTKVGEKLNHELNDSVCNSAITEFYADMIKLGRN